MIFHTAAIQFVTSGAIHIRAEQSDELFSMFNQEET